MTHFHVKEEIMLLPFLCKKYEGMSKTKVKSLLSEHRVVVGRTPISQHNYQLHPGMDVEILPKREQILLKSPYLKVVYEDRWLIVVEKNVGILSMGTPHHAFCVKTLLDEYFSRKKLRVHAHVVHRLDRDTSGLLVYAKTTDVQDLFIEHWHEKVTDRRYYAIVEGELDKPEGTIKSWLKDNKAFFTYSSDTDNGGKLAVTHYRVVATNGQYSLVELRLETGRKNQIRVHLQSLGHPIVGDTKYGSRQNPIGRMCLHAFRLNFIHPVTKETLSFETSFPKLFTKLIEP